MRGKLFQRSIIISILNFISVCSIREAYLRLKINSFVIKTLKDDIMLESFDPVSAVFLLSKFKHVQSNLAYRCSLLSCLFAHTLPSFCRKYRDNILCFFFHRLFRYSKRKKIKIGLYCYIFTFCIATLHYNHTK